MCLGEPFAHCKTKPKDLFTKTYSSATISFVGSLEVILSVYILSSTLKMIPVHKANKLLLWPKRLLYSPISGFFMGHS
jgi:hypothetical protein